MGKKNRILDSNVHFSETLTHTMKVTEPIYWKFARATILKIIVKLNGFLNIPFLLKLNSCSAKSTMRIHQNGKNSSVQKFSGILIRALGSIYCVLPSKHWNTISI